MWHVWNTREVLTWFWWGDTTRTDHLEESKLDGRYIKTHLQQVEWGNRLDSSGSGKGQVAGSCECGNEPSDSIKYGEFLD